MIAFALVLILEGLVPLIAPQVWQRAMAEAARQHPRVIRIIGIICMLSGAVLLQLVH